jgi:hypothetical protein
MALLHALYGKLHLMVNEAKIAVGSDFDRKFLGYSVHTVAYIDLLGVPRQS